MGGFKIDALKRFMKVFDMDKRKFAEYSGFSLYQVNKILKGQFKFRASNVLKMMLALKIPGWYLFYDESEG